MARKLFDVEDSYHIKGRGLVTFPGIIPEGEERFRIGDLVLLKRLDGSQLQWPIGGIEMISYPASARPRPEIVFLLKGLAKEDLPVGSEVWSVDA